MPHQLWLLRHGDAEPYGTRADDSARPLTERGARQGRLAGRALAALGIEFDAVWASPRIRARDTALLACESLAADPVEHLPLSGGFGAQEALELVLGAGHETKLLIVGHEPDFSQIVHDLTGARIDMKKGALAGVRIEGTRAQLIALLRPREIALISAP